MGGSKVVAIRDDMGVAKRVDAWRGSLHVETEYALALDSRVGEWTATVWLGFDRLSASDSRGPLEWQAWPTECQAWWDAWRERAYAEDCVVRPERPNPPVDAHTKRLGRNLEQGPAKSRGWSMLRAMLLGRRLVLVAFAALVGGPSCATATPFHAATEQANRVRTLRQRAAYEFECSEPELDLQPLGTAREVDGVAFYFQYGVSGCGRRGVYVDANDRNLFEPRWIADSGDSAELRPSGQPPRRRPTTGSSRQDGRRSNWD